MLLGFNLYDILMIEFHLIFLNSVFFMKLRCWNDIIIALISERIVVVVIFQCQGFLLSSKNCFFHWLWPITALVGLFLFRVGIYNVSKIYFLLLVKISIKTLKFLHITLITCLLSWKSWCSSFYQILGSVFFALHFRQISRIPILISIKVDLWRIRKIKYCLVPDLIRLPIGYWYKPVGSKCFIKIFVRCIYFGIAGILERIVWYYIMLTFQSFFNVF